MTKQIRDVPDTELALFSDLADQFELVKSMADGQREFLHGVIEFYQTRTSTQTTIAAEKVASTGVQQNDDMRRITAWVAIVAVPTAVTGFFGQNVPYPGFGTRAGFLGSMLLMLVLAVTLYVVFRRKQWL
jgi:magnesium transporter